RKEEKELVDIIVGDDLVEDHQQQHTADDKWIDPLLGGDQEKGIDEPEVAQDQEEDDRDDHRQDEDGHDVAALVLQAAVRGDPKVKDGTANGNEQGVEDIGYEQLKIPHQICFLSLATGMPNCSRYLATVRRAMG